jgi:hypothetical protein
MGWWVVVFVFGGGVIDLMRERACGRVGLTGAGDDLFVSWYVCGW